MKRILFLSLFCLTLVGCEQYDQTKNPNAMDNDNTEKNIRDRDSSTLTPMDQSESEADLKITQNIREALMAEKTLSMNAKNIKIITINGVVTLRGPVANSAERDLIGKKAKAVQGVLKVDNQLELTQSN